MLLVLIWGLNHCFKFFPNDETSFFKEGEGSIHYLAAYNSSVGRGLETKLSTCGY